MNITTANLTRVAGLCAAAAGLLYVIAQPIHPPDEVAHVATGTWRAVHTMTLTMSVLGLVGITGLYLRQAREVGILGLIGYLLFAAFYTVAVGFQFFEAFILPSLATDAPRLAESFLGIVSGAGGPIALPALEAVWLAVSVAYLGGGLLLGIAFFRAAMLPRAASALLAGGAVAPLVLVPLLPHAAERYAAIPVGLALVWLGAALWNEHRQPATAPAPDHRGTALGAAAAE